MAQLSCLAGVALALLELFVTHPLLSRLFGYPDLSDFKSVEGNLALLAVLLATAWILAAFGEEVAYRGYLLNRVTDLLGKSPARWVLGLVLVSVLFGIGHLDQGFTGQLENVIDGLLLGLLYLASKRNLVIPIIAHGVLDTIDFILIYLGHYPGL